MLVFPNMWPFSWKENRFKPALTGRFSLCTSLAITELNIHIFNSSIPKFRFTWFTLFPERWDLPLAYLWFVMCPIFFLYVQILFNFQRIHPKGVETMHNHQHFHTYRNWLPHHNCDGHKFWFQTLTHHGHVNAHVCWKSLDDAAFESIPYSVSYFWQKWREGDVIPPWLFDISDEISECFFPSLFFSYKQSYH